MDITFVLPLQDSMDMIQLLTDYLTQLNEISEQNLALTKTRILSDIELDEIEQAEKDKKERFEKIDNIQRQLLSQLKPQISID